MGCMLYTQLWTKCHGVVDGMCALYLIGFWLELYSGCRLDSELWSSSVGDTFWACTLTFKRQNAICSVYGISPYHAVNTSHHGYTNQSVNDV